MTSRKKKGLGFLISGAAFIVAGTVFMTMPTTPDWLNIGIECVAAVCNVLGIIFVIPDTKEVV